jgi:hypothetical protein
MTGNVDAVQVLLIAGANRALPDKVATLVLNIILPNWDLIVMKLFFLDER